MQSKNNIVLGLADRKRVLGLASILAVFLLVSLIVQQASAKQTSSSFDATFEGTFRVPGYAGESGIFFIEELGEGTEQTFEDFTYTSYLLYNEDRPPPGCGLGSSTGVAGSADLTFTNGQIRLKLISGTACFSFPIVSLEEQWLIASGTGNYAGVTGKLSRQLEGDVTDGSASGTFNGTMKFHD